MSHHKHKHRHRHREPGIVVEAPPKPKIKLRASPKARDVAKARNAIYHLVEKYGTRRYKRKRYRADRVVEKALKRFNIMQTSSEQYWRLAFTCILIGA